LLAPSRLRAVRVVHACLHGCGLGAGQPACEQRMYAGTFFRSLSLRSALRGARVLLAACCGSPGELVLCGDWLRPRVWLRRMLHRICGGEEHETWRRMGDVLCVHVCTLYES
jgi:hypothetical protein